MRTLKEVSNDINTMRRNRDADIDEMVEYSKRVDWLGSELKDILLAEKCQKVNTLHSYLNRVIPLLHDEIAKGFGLKSDGTLLKKDRDRLNAIIQKPPFRNYLEAGGDYIVLRADITYNGAAIDKNGICISSYYKQVIYLTGLNGKLYNFEPLKTYSLKQVKKAREQKAILSEKVNELNKKMSKLQTLES